MTWRIESKLKAISFAGAALACVLGVVGLRGLRTVNATMVAMHTPRSRSRTTKTPT